MPIISNPSNPTGHTRADEELKELIQMAEQSNNGIFFTKLTKCFTRPQ